MVSHLLHVACVYPEGYESSAQEILPQMERDFGMKIHSVNKLEDLFALITDPARKLDYVCVRYEMLRASTANTHEVLSALHTLIKCTKYRDSNGQYQPRDTEIIAVISVDSPSSLLKEIAATDEIASVSIGIDKDPTKNNYNNLHQTWVEILSRQDKIPKTVRAIIRPRKVATKSNGVKLTVRQRQIYDIIVTRGASNKAIAKMMNISESTVKLHIGAILRKFGVRNRTQLAVFAKTMPVTEV